MRGRRTLRIRFLLEEVDERLGGRELPLLSVSLYLGVVPRSDITADPPRAEELSRYKVCRPGDIVVNRMRAFQGAVGRGAVRGVVSPDYIVMRPLGEVDSRWLHHVMRSKWFVSEMSMRIRGIGSIDAGNVRTPRVSAEEIGDIRVAVRPVGQQRAIADFLDAETVRIDALIAKKRRLVDTLDEMCMSVMMDGVRGALTGAPQEPTGLPWIESRGAGWREAKLTLIARLGTGHTPSREHPEWWVDCTVPWITTGEVSQMRSDRIEFVNDTRESISKVGMQNSSAVLHPAGTVVLSRTASAGYSAIMGRDMATSQDFVTWTCGPLLRPRFLLLCLRVMRQDLLGRLAMGSTHQTIYMPDIESLRLVLPPIAEQDRVVDAVWDRLSPIHRTIDKIGRQIDLLEEHRQALITAAVTGELDVPGVAA